METNSIDTTGRIVIGVDGSPPSIAALPYAAPNGDALGAPRTAMYAACPVLVHHEAHD